MRQDEAEPEDPGEDHQDELGTRVILVGGVLMALGTVAIVTLGGFIETGSDRDLRPLPAYDPAMLASPQSADASVDKGLSTPVTGGTLVQPPAG